MAEKTLLYQQWLIGIKERSDTTLFAQLYLGFWETLYLHTLRRVKDEQSAEDLVQELFVQFWERRASLDVHMNLPAYLYGILKFKIIDFFNSNKANEKLVAGWAHHMFDFVQQHPEELETYLWLEKLIEKELQAMPNNMHQAILLKWDHYSIKEIATKLNLSEQTVKNNLSEAGKRLQRSLMLHKRGNYEPLLLLFIQAMEQWIKH